MATYYIKFKHTLEETFTAKIEASSKKEALEIFDESPFDYLIDEEPEDTQGLDIEIIETRVG
jgi:hypothetical protein